MVMDFKLSSLPQCSLRIRAGGIVTMSSAVSRSSYSESGKGKPVAALVDDLLAALRKRGALSLRQNDTSHNVDGPGIVTDTGPMLFCISARSLGLVSSAKA